MYNAGTSSAATATTVTWGAWNGTNCSTDNTWTGWVSGAASTASAVSIWCSWNTDGTGGSGYVAQGQPPRQQTPEELAASARQQQEYQEQIKEQEKAKQKAKRAATKLFVGVVGRKAYGLFKKRGYHEVIGHSGKRYRLRLGVRIEEMAGNFGDSVSARLCIHTDAGIPEMDTLVIQMLLVMSGEDGEKVLHKTANRTAEAA